MAGPKNGLLAPDLQAAEELPSFSGDAVEHGGEYDQCAFVEVAWGQRSISNARFDTVLFRQANLAKCKLRDVSFNNVRIQASDLSNADWSGVQTRRVEMASSRLTGLLAAEGRYQHTLFLGCRADYSAFQLSKLEWCRFENCNLAESSFEAATLKRVVFRNCDLRNARFLTARLDEVDLRGSQLEGLAISLEALGGVTIDSLQAAAIASLTGVKIDDGLTDSNGARAPGH